MPTPHLVEGRIPSVLLVELGRDYTWRWEGRAQQVRLAFPFRESLKFVNVPSNLYASFILLL